jgi:hypothetical protein
MPVAAASRSLAAIARSARPAREPTSASETTATATTRPQTIATNSAPAGCDEPIFNSGIPSRPISPPVTPDQVRMSESAIRWSASVANAR